MKRKIKEKLIEWSREVEKVERFSKLIALILLVMLVNILLYDIGVATFSEQTYSVCLTLLIIMLFVSFGIIIIKDILIIIKSKYSEYRSDMKLIYIIFSHRKVTEDIIFALFFIDIIIPMGGFEIIWHFILLILYILLPERLEKYCKTKLQG